MIFETFSRKLGGVNSSRVLRKDPHGAKIRFDIHPVDFFKRHVHSIEPGRSAGAWSSRYYSFGHDLRQFGYDPHPGLPPFDEHEYPYRMLREGKENRMFL